MSNTPFFPYILPSRSPLLLPLIVLLPLSVLLPLIVLLSLLSLPSFPSPLPLLDYSGGAILYNGPPSSVAPFLSSAGYLQDAESSDADFCIDVLNGLILPLPTDTNKNNSSMNSSFYPMAVYPSQTYPSQTYSADNKDHSSVNSSTYPPQQQRPQSLPPQTQTQRQDDVDIDTEGTSYTSLTIQIHTILGYPHTISA